LGFLKSFGTVVLGFLFFLSLSVFSLAFLLNSTLLSPGFVKAQVNRIDVSAVARDLTEKQIDEQLPAELGFLKEGIYNVIDAQEPWLKDQANRAIDTGYDYFLGKTDTLSISVPLVELKSDLKDSLWQELNRQLIIWLRDNTRTELIPYIDQNLAAYRQVLPLNLLPLSDAQLKSYINDFLQQVQDQITATGQAPAFTGLLEILVRPYFNSYYDQYAAQIPDNLVADAGTIPPDVMAQLELVRQYIGYFRQGFYYLIAFMVVLAAGIFLIHRNIPDPSRALGIDLVIYGALDLAGALVARGISLSGYWPEIPASLKMWLDGIYHDITGIMLTFSIVVLVVGAALIVISFVFKKKEPEEQMV
jgi:hypothetical protein